MDEEKKELIKNLAVLGTLGINLVILTVIGLVIGIYLDKITGFKPVCTILFLILGIIAGFVKIFKETLKINK